MLFDLSGRKGRMVKWVYGGLAAVFAIGFVGFGVGSDVGGGLLGDGHSGGARGHSGGGESIEDRRERLEERLDGNPRDARAWRELSVLEGTAAYEQSGGRHGEGTELSDDWRRRMELSVAAFESYREIEGDRRVDRAVAAAAARSYASLGRGVDAVSAQRLAVTRRDAQGWFLLAQYAALARDSGLVERALDRAERAAPEEQRAALRAQRDPLVEAALTGGLSANAAGEGGTPPGGEPPAHGGG